MCGLSRLTYFLSPPPTSGRPCCTAVFPCEYMSIPPGYQHGEPPSNPPPPPPREGGGENVECINHLPFHPKQPPLYINTGGGGVYRFRAKHKTVHTKRYTQNGTPKTVHTKRYTKRYTQNGTHKTVHTKRYTQNGTHKTPAWVTA